MWLGHEANIFAFDVCSCKSWEDLLSEVVYALTNFSFHVLLFSESYATRLLNVLLKNVY